MNNVATTIQADFTDQTSIVIDGVRVRQFFNETIQLAIDSLGAGFSFDVPFFHETKEYRELFRPFRYQDIQIYIGQNLVMNGTIEKITPTLSSDSTILNVQGRSKPGVIVDCSFENEDTKEWLKADLSEISDTAIGKFGLTASFPDGPGAIFEQAGPDSPATKIFDFLQNLAKQRGLLMSQTSGGQLLFRKPKVSGVPVAELIEGQQGLILSTATYDGTKRFSNYDVYGQEPGKNDNLARLIAKIEKKNAPAEPSVEDLKDNSIFAVRPKAVNANDTNQGNIEDAVKWVYGADLAESINIPLGYEGWLRPDGELWAENELISVQAPSLMIYKPAVMLIKSVLFTGSPEQKTTGLTLTLPEAYTGEIPERFPWGE